MNSKLKAIPIYILLILFPALFGLLLYFMILNIDRNHEIERIKIKLSERAVDFTSKSNPVDYFKPHFKELNKSLLPFIANKPTQSGVKLTLNDVTKIIEDYCNKLNENIRVAIFDTEGKLINSNNLLEHEKRFYQWAWFDIHGLGNIDYNGRRADQALIMGREFNDEVMYHKKEVCIQTNSLGKTGVFYFCKEDDASNGIIIFVEYKHTNIEILEAKSRNYATSDQPIIIYSKNEKKCISSNFGHVILPYEETSTDKFLDGYVDNDMVWKGLNADDYKLLSGQRLENPEKYKNQSNKAILIFILIIIIATIFFFKNIANLGGIHISIRYKLIFIFALAVYMPALSLWVLSYTSIHDRRTAIENNIKKEMLEILSKIDLGHKDSVEEATKCFREFDKYVESLSGKAVPTASEIEKKLKDIVGKNRFFRDIFNYLDVRTSDLTQIYTNHNEESNNRIKPIGRILALIGTERYIPERIAKAKPKRNPSDVLVTDFMGNPILGFSGIFERPHEITFQNFEGSSIYWYWNYFADDNNPIAFYIGNIALRFTTMSHFRSILKKRYTIDNVNIQLIDFHSNVLEFIPDTAAKYPDINALIEVSNINQTIETATVNYLDNKYYCLCMPGNSMKECFLLSLYPVSEIDYKIQEIHSTIYSIIMILLVVSIFTALLLAKTFIIPVNELDRGLTALRKRETETRISIENNDELGQLGSAFNQMMAEIKDMLLAGAVQQCLIPTGNYKMEGYDCRVYNQMATDVGGDYADIFELPGDRVLIVIGDVTGHGVSSALLTAMVKGSIYRYAHKDTPLIEIVTNTSSMISELLNKKKLMTFCAIVLDKASGAISICNAGHPYPIIHSEPGKIRMIAEDSFPLGVSAKRSYHKTAEDMLTPGETLILYTDGFPEAEDSNGKTYGYKAFQNFVADNNIVSAENFENSLREEFKRHHGDTELSDDITFIIIKRTDN